MTIDDEKLNELLESDLKELNIDCADCDKLLLKMVRSRQTNHSQSIIVCCPFCGGQSWLQKLEGVYFQSPPEGLGLGDMEEKDGNYILKMEIING